MHYWEVTQKLNQLLRASSLVEELPWLTLMMPTSPQEPSIMAQKVITMRGAER